MIAGVNQLLLLSVLITPVCRSSLIFCVLARGLMPVSQDHRYVAQNIAVLAVSRRQTLAAETSKSQMTCILQKHATGSARVRRDAKAASGSRSSSQVVFRLTCYKVRQERPSARHDIEAQRQFDNWISIPAGCARQKTTLFNNVGCVC